jgi:hexokinase
VLKSLLLCPLPAICTLGCLSTNSAAALLLTCCRQRLGAALADVCGLVAAASIEMQLAQDGSVLGAAFLAVAAVQWEAEHAG